MRSRNGNCITDEVMEMPRCFSSAIQSEVACRAALRPFTVPAIWIAPPNSSSFSVSVVLPGVGMRNDGERAPTRRFLPGRSHEFLRELGVLRRA